MSSTSFKHVMHQIVNKMDSGPSQMAALDYIPFYKPKNLKPVPKLLEDAKTWAKLVHDVGQYIATFENRKGTAKTVNVKEYSLYPTLGMLSLYLLYTYSTYCTYSTYPILHSSSPCHPSS
jgi:hypothetical protein